MMKLFELFVISKHNGIMLVEKSEKPKRRPITDEKKRERIVKQYASEQHEYIIKGVKIIAPSKKVAIKIYSNKYRK